ncbi:MAG: ATP-dependent DNA helicase RecG [Pseudomonadota bacterium]
MSGRAGRPEALYALFSPLETLETVGPKTAKALERLGHALPRDLILTPPHGFTDRRLRNTIRGMALPATLTVEVEVGAHQPPRVKGRPHRVQVRDAVEEFQLVFFHAREDWLKRQLPPGARRIVSGKVEHFDHYAQMVHPDHILSPDDAAELPAYEPVYGLGAGVTQRGMQKAVAAALDGTPALPEWIDRSLVAREGWADWRASLLAMHDPADGGIEVAAKARARLGYDELLSHQVALALARAHMRRGKGRASKGDGRLGDAVLAALPYQPTGAQIRALSEIAGDMASTHRMNRLLQGDVGAGKTLVAFMAMLVAVEAGGQAALMAPTELLARQHMSALGPLATAAGVELEILTGRDKGGERADKLARIASGAARVVIGTHALFQRDVGFADLRLAVIDEQHRFGVRQRLELGTKGAGADILVMTATPIPRSLALASHGDMDLSVLDEKPPGRQPIETVLIPEDRLSQIVERLRAALAAGRQAYWVCPLVEESETVDMTAAEERAAALRDALGADLVGLVHGQMPHAARDAAMRDFAAGHTRLLVATTVIEVGVDVPSATIMVIESAERFGLAQLHQLRGRVGRGSEASTCLLVYTPPLGEAARARLQVLRETEDGFRIAEEDLRLRGAGDLIGHAQSGLPRFRIADLERDVALMRIAQDDARLVMAQDPGLKSPRGEALRLLLWLMGRDASVRLLSVG